jgi:putative ABC transport system ATP-binding protein
MTRFAGTMLPRDIASSVDLRATRSRLSFENVQIRTIRIRGLNHFYGEGEARKQVLFDNNFDAYAGEIVIMTGPSGSGKTTLLTLIGTLRSVQEGSLQVLSEELAGASQAQLVEARRNIGFIFQAHNLFGSLTALQNVRMGLELFSFSDAEMRERATRLLTRLGLGERLGYKPDRLSGGQKQRVAIARGLAHGPKIVLADEPTAALDEHSGREVVTLLRELASQERMTIILVTHDNRILDVADRIVNMVDGRIKSDVLVKEADTIVEFIRKLDVFHGLTVGTLAAIADKMWTEQYEAGDVILRQGDKGQSFYVVRKGAVDVERVENDQASLVATLKMGQCFGEEALLRGQPRSATIRAREPTLLYVLGEEDFREAVSASGTLRDELHKIIFERQ